MNNPAYGRISQCGTSLRVLLLVLLATVLSSAMAAQTSIDNSFSTTLLRLGGFPDRIEWRQDTVLQHGAYSWRIAFPAGRSYKSAALAFADPDGRVFLVDPRGRPTLVKEASPIQKLLDSASGEDSEARQTTVLSKADYAYYFTGWNVEGFGFASARTLPAGLPQIPVSPDAEALTFILPSPSLLEPSGPLRVLVALEGADGKGWDCLVCGAEAEFLEGEGAFFRSKPEYRARSYSQKALALFAASLGSPGEDYTKESARAAALVWPGVKMGDSDWTLFAADPLLPTLAKNLATTWLNLFIGEREHEEDLPLSLGFDDPAWNEGLYGVNRLIPFTMILTMNYMSEVTVFQDDLFGSVYASSDSIYFNALGAEAGRALAKAAFRYYSWGLDYAGGLGGRPGVWKGSASALKSWIGGPYTAASKKVGYFTGKLLPLDLASLPELAGLPSGWHRGLDLDSPFEGGRAGQPLPVGAGGLASPRSFAAAQVAAAKGKDPATLAPPSLVSAEVDALGFLFGSAEMADLANKLRGFEGERPAVLVDVFLQGSGKTEVPVLARSLVESMTMPIPDLDVLMPGDLLVSYGGVGGGRETLRLGIVVSVPRDLYSGPGSPPEAFLRKLVLVGVVPGSPRIIVDSCLPPEGGTGGFAPDRAFQFRRLLTRDR